MHLSYAVVHGKRHQYRSAMLFKFNGYCFNDIVQYISIFIPLLVFNIKNGYEKFKL